jgi:SAM-dependent methyltransferase
MTPPDLPLDESRLPAAVESAAHLFQGSDSEFFRRVWRTGLGVYRARLAALGMRGHDQVLDAGSGMGQWTVCLAEANEKVHGVDLNLDRVRATAMVTGALGLRNVRMSCQVLERLGYPNESFDAIFSYSVLHLTDYRKVITEFFRVLKPGGRLYICSNGVGWYVYNVLRPHNRSSNFDPRRMALETMGNTLMFAATGQRREGKQLIVPSQRLARELKAAGFGQVAVGGEGTLRVSSDYVPRSFYRSRYYGLEGVYELLARRLYV